jgi:hypothetical protein
VRRSSGRSSSLTARSPSSPSSRRSGATLTPGWAPKIHAWQTNPSSSWSSTTYSICTPLVSRSTAARPAFGTRARSNQLSCSHSPRLTASTSTRTSSPWPRRTRSTSRRHRRSSMATRGLPCSPPLSSSTRTTSGSGHQEDMLYMAMIEIAGRTMTKAHLANLLREPCAHPTACRRERQRAAGATGRAPGSASLAGTSERTE